MEEMQNKYVIRPAVIADLPTLLEFEQGIVRAERPFDPTLKPDPIHYYDLAEHLNSPDVDVVVAEESGVIIGSGSLRPRESRSYCTPEVHGFLGFMYVEPDYRGRGINKLITAELLRLAKKRGYSEVQLTVYSDNISAIRAYEKVGFRPYLLTMRLEN